jgi:hypothetical protein
VPNRRNLLVNEKCVSPSYRRSNLIGSPELFVKILALSTIARMVSIVHQMKELTEIFDFTIEQNFIN